MFLKVGCNTFLYLKFASQCKLPVRNGENISAKQVNLGYFDNIQTEVISTEGETV